MILRCLSFVLVISCCYAYVISENNPEDTSHGVHWALIVAGSNGWFNYRHQADACHAYQILHKHGIPDERIVVMMYDDLAENQENPTPGIIINHPNGSDVYKGVPKDYTSKDVTPANFLNILKGNSDAMSGIGSGKVIKSTNKDHVFVFFVDHGAPGLIAFPTSELHATDFLEVLKDMHKNNQYAQMVIYIEACESGSMFQSLLPKDINIYATTAANAKESSYACYYDQKRKTYLGDVYSVKWMEDSDSENLKKETLHKQFKIVRQETNTSHVMQYGDKNISSEVLSLFQGGKSVEPEPKLPVAELNAVASEEVPLAILHHRLLEATSNAEQKDILRQINAIKQLNEEIKQTMQSIANRASIDSAQADRVILTKQPVVDFDCYQAAIASYKQECFDFIKHTYALRHLYTFVNLCEEGRPINVIQEAIKTTCNSV